MKILQLVMARQFRGAEIFALQLTRALNKTGTKTWCVSLYAAPHNPLDVSGVDWIELNGSRGSFLSWKLLQQFRKHIKRHSPDIVQANAGDTLKYAVIAKLLFGLRYKIIFRNASTVSSYLRTRVQQWLYTRLYKRVDYVISVSDYSRKDFLKVFPFIGQKITTIPNGLNVTQAFKPISSINSKEFNIVHVGGFTFEKNHEGLLRIFERVLKIIPNARLWLLGDGPLRAAVDQRIREKVLQRIEVVGAVHNPLDYMAAASVFVLPSHIEGMPGVILEAMLCNVPVVAYRVGGIGEVVVPEQTGYLIEPNNEEAFVLAIKNIRDERPVAMVSAAHSFVCSIFASEMIASRFCAIYQKLTPCKG